jgi:DNA primase catalytic core
MFEFVMRREGIEFKEALEKLALKAGIEYSPRADDSGRGHRSRSSALHDVNALAADYFLRQLEGAHGEEAMEYLVSRGIDRAAARRRSIGFAPGGVNSLMAYLRSIGADSQAVVQAGLVVKGSGGDTWRDMFTNRITIAIRDPRGNVVGFGARAMGDAQPKYLNTHETSIFSKSQLLYGLHWASEAIRASGKAIVVEGYMDVVAAQERGFKNVVACMGTSVTAKQLQVLATVLPDTPENPPSIVLCLDADEAGQQAAMRGLRTALSEFGRRSAIEIRIASPVVSERGVAKDPDEAIRNSPADWMTSIENADEIIDFVVRASLNRHNTANDTGIDAALDEIEPYFSNLPPNTIKEQRRVASLSERLEVDAEHLTQVLLAKRAARQAVNRDAIAPAPKRRHRPRRSGIVKSATPSVVVPARWELDLLACMVQYDFAIDHITIVEPHHFTDPVRTRVFENLRSAGSFDECVAMIDGDADAVALLDLLMTSPLSPSDDNFEDEAAIIQIAETCAKRTRREFLTRNKKREVQLAKENGNMFRDEDMISAVRTNREIREMANPRQAVPKH